MQEKGTKELTYTNHMGHLGSYELDSLCQEPHSIVVFYEHELQVEVLYLPGSFIIKKKKKNGLHIIASSNSY
jgi:hypothetical protein